jgi:hypothetical protein
LEVRNAVAATPAKRVGVSPALCVAVSALLASPSALPALPPTSVGSSSQSEPAPAPVKPGVPAAGAGAADDEETSWWQRIGLLSPRYALYGSVGYEWLRNSSENSNSTSQGLTSMFGARLNSYVWQPWFGKFFGDMRMHLGQNSMNSGDMPGASGGSKNMMLSGNARLSLMYMSRFPFEAYIDRNYNRTTTEFSPLAGSTLTQRFGFTQGYSHESGANASLDWNRNTQSGNSSFGGTRTDSILLNLAHKLPEHIMGSVFSRSVTTQQGTDSRSMQNNLSVSHNYAPEDEYYTVDSTVNVNTNNFRFDNVDSNSRLAQISSVASWRPEDEPYSITAAVRVLGLASELLDKGVSTSADKRTLETANLSLGMTYTLSQETYAYGAINANTSTSNGERKNSASESVSITHSPAGSQIGGFSYRWSASAGASNTSEADGQNSSQLSLQLSHSLSRQYELDGGSRINFNGSQAIVAAIQSRRRNFQDRPENVFNAAASGGDKRLTHNAGLSWTSNEGLTNAMVHLSISDSRALGGTQDAFQMVNVQFTGNLQTGSDSTWSGNLGVQAVKQDLGQLQSVIRTTQSQATDDIKVTSNGGITYRNARLFGVRRLTFNSSVRLSSSALLPMLGGATDYETAAWDTRVDYAIGRLNFRANAVIARTTTPIIRRVADGFELAEGEPKVNKSIMFTVTRTFGY